MEETQRFGDRSSGSRRESRSPRAQRKSRWIGIGLSLAVLPGVSAAVISVPQPARIRPLQAIRPCQGPRLPQPDPAVAVRPRRRHQHGEGQGDLRRPARRKGGTLSPPKSMQSEALPAGTPAQGAVTSPPCQSAWQGLAGRGCQAVLVDEVRLHPAGGKRGDRKGRAADSGRGDAGAVSQRRSPSWPRAQRTARPQFPSSPAATRPARRMWIPRRSTSRPLSCRPAPRTSSVPRRRSRSSAVSTTERTLTLGATDPRQRSERSRVRALGRRYAYWPSS